MKRSVYGLRVACLWVVALLLLLPVVGSASPSVSPFDMQGLDEGVSVKEIEGKIRECQKTISFLNGLVQRYPSTRETLSQAMDLFQGVIYQLTNLKGDLSSPASGLSVTLPAISTTPPYPLEIYSKLLVTYSSIAQQLEAANLKVQLLKDELESLESEMKDLSSQWFDLRKKVPPPPTYYLVLAQLLNAQAQYLIGSLKLSRTTKKIEALSKLRSEADTLLKRVFSHLKLEEGDLKRAEAYAKQTSQNLEKVRDQVRETLTRLNRQAALLEVKERRVSDRLQDPKLSAKERRALRLEKERLEVLQEKTFFLRKIANQKERKALLDYMEASFGLQWVKCYTGTCSSREKAKNIELWKGRIAKLKTYLESTKAAFNRLQTTSEIINSKVIALEQAGTSSGGRSLERLKAAYRELLEVVDSLSQLYQENMGKSKSMILRMDYTLNLFRKRAGGLERLYTWFVENKTAISNQVKTVLYYPLWTIGQTPFTLATILRFILVLVVGILLVRLLRHRTYKVLTERFALSPGPVNSLTTLIYYALILVVVLVALSEVGMDMKQVTLIFGALGVGIGFGLQTVANNFVSGIILLTERSIQAEDIVELEDGTLGEVRKISIRSTVIRTYDGLDIIVPNSELVSGRVTTWTYEDDWRRLRIPFGVAYGSDPDEVSRLAEEAARDVGITVEDPQHSIHVWFDGFGDSSLNFTLVVWIKMHGVKSKTGLKSDYYFALYRRLGEAGIEIPFPQQDLHIRSIHPQVREQLKGLEE